LHRVGYQPHVASHHYDLGLLYQQMGRTREAITEFQTAKSDATKAGDCLLALGQCFQQINQNSLAMAHYQQAIDAFWEANDSKKLALYLATKLAIELKDREKAERFSSALAAIDFSYKDIGELLDKVNQI